jgi:integrase
MNQSQQVGVDTTEGQNPQHLLVAEVGVAKPKRPYQPMGVPYRTKTGLWAIRARQAGKTISLSGFKTPQEARYALAQRLQAGEPEGERFASLMVAQALQEHALGHLRHLRSARSQARSINTYLRAAGVNTLLVKHDAGASRPWVEINVRHQSGDEGTATPAQSEVTVSDGRNYSARLRAELARTRMSDVSSWHVLRLLQALEGEGRARATVLKERSLLGRLFNHACQLRGWPAFARNPTVGLRLSGPARRRERLMGHEERERLEAAFKASGEDAAACAFLVLAEVAIDAKHLLEGATWRDALCSPHVFFDSRRAGWGHCTALPMSQRAAAALQARYSGADQAKKIFGMEFKAFKAIWRRVCRTAGVENLRIQDLRRSALAAWCMRVGGAFGAPRVIDGVAYDLNTLVFGTDR